MSCNSAMRAVPLASSSFPSCSDLSFPVSEGSKSFRRKLLPSSTRNGLTILLAQLMAPPQGLQSTKCLLRKVFETLKPLQFLTLLDSVFTWPATGGHRISVGSPFFENGDSTGARPDDCPNRPVEKRALLAGKSGLPLGRIFPRLDGIVDLLLADHVRIRARERSRADQQLVRIRFFLAFKGVKLLYGSFAVPLINSL